ncbi:MAG: transcriptional regulator [Candidatus Brocadiae bacterium]|nr:transcriptional regulator [Candidatus Brocadiia bacterium]
MKPEPSASAREKILFYLKTKGPQTASRIAGRIGITPMAVRQHLYQLEQDGQVTFEDRKAPVGRPARHWGLTAGAAALFPDSHADLLVGLIDAVRGAFGEPGLERLIAERVRQQSAAYRKRMPESGSFEKRLSVLVGLRRDEGYMAEWQKERDGSYTLVENHCPICDAAKACPGICGGELALFQAVLSGHARVERTEHMMEGARRCVYRLHPAGR